MWGNGGTELSYLSSSAPHAAQSSGSTETENRLARTQLGSQASVERFNLTRTWQTELAARRYHALRVRLVSARNWPQQRWGQFAVEL